MENPGLSFLLTGSEVGSLVLHCGLFQGSELFCFLPFLRPTLIVHQELPSDQVSPAQFGT